MKDYYFYLIEYYNDNFLMSKLSGVYVSKNGETPDKVFNHIMQIANENKTHFIPVIVDFHYNL